MNQPTSTISPPLPATIGLSSVLGRESALRRLTCLVLVMLTLGLFLFINDRLWIPLHPGVDQNGYLVGGKQILQTGSMAYQPRRADNNQIDPYQFVGRMWVGFDLGTPNERHLPKYPVGLPLVYAGALALGGQSLGVAFAYLVSPVSMTLALLGTYFLARLLLGSIPALFVTILVAASPVTLMLVNNPNSHAFTLLLVIWGMYLAVRWWIRGGLLTPLFAGILAGASVSVRYTEGLLILPLGLIALFRLADSHWRSRRDYLGATALAIGWLAPVVALLVHNRLTMHAWTGYDPTNESTGFAWKYFIENWDTMLRLMYQTGMTLVFPMAVAGLAAAFVWNWRLALVLNSWVLPCLFVYTAYYWAPEGLNIGYTRFFLTIFPALAICAFGLLLWPVAHAQAAHHPPIAAFADDRIDPPQAAVHSFSPAPLRLAALLGLSVITLISVPLGVANIHQSIRADLASRTNAQARAAAVLTQATPGSLLFCEDPNLVNHLQLAGQYTLYTSETFLKTVIERLSERQPDEPGGLDPGRAKYLANLAHDKTQQDLDAIRDALIASALATHHRVFVFSQSPASAGPIRRPAGWRQFNATKFQVKQVVAGTDPVAMPRNNPLGRFGIAPVGRDKSPATLPYATWQILEITLRPPTTAPAPRTTTRPSEPPIK